MHSRNNFDVLRLLFAVMVLLSHSFEIVDGHRKREPLTWLFGSVSFGELGVDGFFLISGFLIVASWRRSMSVVEFAMARVARIFPAFVVASLLCALLFGPLGAASYAYVASIDWIQFVIGALTLRGPFLPPTFVGTHYPVVNNALWTIKFEFACYILVAIFGLAGGLRRSRPWLIFTGIVLALVMGLSVAATCSRCSLPQVHDLVHVSLRFLMFFGVGGAFLLLRDRLRFSSYGFLVAASVLLPLMFSKAFAELAIATVGAYLLFGLAFSTSSLLSRVRPRIDVSYGVYLYGWPLQKALLWFAPDLHPLLLFGAALLLALLCGWASWRWVEAPALRLKVNLAARLTRAS